ncbi:helix-turn-helix domain-containing protein [Anaerococcus tetradius]|uniref:DNA-binding helix-turn-helix protein n=1 Tax=Anaerococcus tetradius TaxID=33036 RepID=A0A133KCZ3_9FIRM|nr:helix-turn-helix domain-containing protein [Anaerococcus tetradius]KWZ77448.1 DNA-binding helix-turn-helix protein [Anaerococcus tetradius]
MNYFGKNIRYLRKLKNMTQDDLAEKLGYKSFTTIQKWESGNSEPNLKKLKQLAEIFNVDIDNLAQIDLSKAYNNHNTKSNKDQKILRAFNQLNNEGQEKAIAYTQDLVDSGKYAIQSLPTIEEMIDYLKDIPMAAFDGKLDIYKMSEEELYTLYKLIKDNE